MAIERRRIKFYGRVQGVGFRQRAGYAAASLGLTGWVKNEYDETVSMEVQGEAALIDKMLRTLNTGSFIRIEEIESQRIELKEERNFRVLY